MLDPDCFEKIGLSFSARGLPKLDMSSNTDPYLYVFLKDKRSGQLLTIGNTTVIRDNQNPDWPELLRMDYRFEETQEVVVRAYDYDSGSLHEFNKQDFIGEVNFTVSNLMCARGRTLAMDFVGGHHIGKLHIRAEAISDTRDIFVAQFQGTKLANKDGFFGKSDPFLVISRCNEDGSYTVCYKNDKIDNNLSPIWPQARISMVSLCNNDIDRPLRIEIFDWESSGRHKSMGIVDTSVRALIASHSTPLNVIEADKKAKSKSYVNSGTLQANNAIIEKHPSLTDYIMGGCEISLILAIDFTGSNGDPTSPQSLHYTRDGYMNPYQQALSSIGKIVEPYDADKMFPVFGFGAKVRAPGGGWSPVQHCFPVYGGGVEVQGVDGIMHAYADAVKNVALSGPTLFTPLIEAATHIAEVANCSQEKQKYFVLLIITDGVINDLDSTIGAVIRASGLPLSIIIVGVGPEDFSSMRVLDADNKRLAQGGRTAARDIVQFVGFNETLSKGPLALSEDTLKEVPGQVLQYMAMRRISPNPKN